MPTPTEWAAAIAGPAPLPRPVRVGAVEFGAGRPALIAGPCVIESEDLCLTIADHLAGICRDLGIGYVFKASFDKANRTSIRSFRGQGRTDGLRVLERVRREIGVPILTDVHESDQVAEVAAVVDVVQVPAFLCRQTDLLVACGRHGRAVNIKKGQFLPPEDMAHVATKVVEAGQPNVLLTERGAVFGYRDLVFDPRGLLVMRALGYPVIFDATHVVQQIGSGGGVSGGRPEFIPGLLRAAIAVGIDGIFAETHPDPARALSDGATMVPLDQMRPLLASALAIQVARRESVAEAPQAG